MCREVSWLTKEGTSIFVPKSEPVVIPAYMEDPDRTSFRPLYDEGMLDHIPDPIYDDLPCPGCAEGLPHPELEVMAFDVGNVRDHQYVGSVCNHLYGLARDVLGLDYDAFKKVAALRNAQILWFMREQEQFFRESIHERFNGWQPGSRTIFLSHINDRQWTLVAHVMSYEVQDDGRINRWIWSIPYDKEGFRVGNGTHGDDAITIVMPLSPNIHLADS
jgi:hypothetical protein